MVAHQVSAAHSMGPLSLGYPTEVDTAVAPHGPWQPVRHKAGQWRRLPSLENKYDVGDNVMEIM